MIGSRSRRIALAIMLALPVVLALFSPYLPYRSPIYLVAGFAGILTLPLLVVQPLLPIQPATQTPGSRAFRRRKWHRLLGPVLLVLTLVHVTGLYFTSPPDVVDALLLRAPTLFSVFGVIALWALVIVAILAALRRKLPARLWKALHLSGTAVITVSVVIHAVQIEGAMEPISKALISAACLCTLTASIVWSLRRNRRSRRAPLL